MESNDTHNEPLNYDKNARMGLERNQFEFLVHKPSELYLWPIKKI